MGIDEQIAVDEPQPGPATAKGPVNCTALGGVNTPSGPPVKVLLGTDGTQTIPAGNTGAGVVHLTGCVYYKSVNFGKTGPSSNPGNSGHTGAS
jgi:hypothetical protein